MPPQRWNQAVGKTKKKKVKRKIDQEAYLKSEGDVNGKQTLGPLTQKSRWVKGVMWGWGHDLIRTAQRGKQPKESRNKRTSCGVMGDKNEDGVLLHNKVVVGNPRGTNKGEERERVTPPNKSGGGKG